MVRGLRRHWVILVPFAWYYSTAARTITHGDAGLNIDAITGPIVSTHVNNHNLSVITGWILYHLLPFGSVAFRSTFQAIFLGGLTVALFYFLIYRIFNSRLTAGVAALVLTVSNSLWWHSTLVETATGGALLMVLALWFIVLYREDRKDKYLLLLIATAGLGIFQHAQLGVIGLAAAIIALGHVYNLLRSKNYRHILRFILKAAGVSLLALLPFCLTLLLRDAPIAGGIRPAFESALGGSFREFMFQGSTLYGLLDELYLVWLQFPSPFLILIPAGLWIFARRWKFSSPTLAIYAMCFVNAWFFIYFNTWDRFEFLLISFLILAFWGAFALDRLIRFQANRRHPLLTGTLILAGIFSLVFPPYLYANLAKWGRDPGSYWHARYNNNYSPNSHDIAELIANPNKRGYLDVDRYAEALFAKLPPGATYIDDDSRTHYQIEYFRKYYGLRPDLNITFLNSWNIPNWGLNTMGLVALLENTYQTDGELYLISLAHPYSQALSVAPRRYEFREFPLSSDKWVYRLVTISETGLSSEWDPSYSPKSARLMVGLDFEKGPGRITDTLSATDKIMAKLNFAANSQPFWISFRWHGPDGSIRHQSAPFLVPIGNTDVWSYLEGVPKWPKGTWQVVASVNQTEIANKKFEVK